MPVRRQGGPFRSPTRAPLPPPPQEATAPAVDAVTDKMAAASVSSGKPKKEKPAKEAKPKAEKGARNAQRSAQPAAHPLRETTP